MAEQNLKTSPKANSDRKTEEWADGKCHLKENGLPIYQKNYLKKSTDK